MSQQQTIWNDAGEIVVDTRLAAAESVAPHVPIMLRRVFDYVRERGEQGATDEELALSLGLDSTARARRVELRDGGQLVDSGRRRPRRSGRAFTIWTSTGKPLNPTT